MATTLKCIERLRVKAESIGASVDWDHDSSDIILDAPRGYVWSCNGCSIIVAPGDNGSQTWWAEAAKDAEEDASMGLRMASDEEAEDVGHARGEDWTPPADGPEEIAWPSR